MQNKELTNKINEFLEELKKKGSINMMGAAPILEEKFKLETKEARLYLLQWMQST